MSALKVLLALVSFAASSVAVVVFWHDIGDVLHGARAVIVADVRLQNQCEHRDNVFILRDLETGKYASFAGGRAKLRTTERNRVQIEYAPIYTEVKYSSSAYPASAQMTLVARCRSRPFFLVDWLTAG